MEPPPRIDTAPEALGPRCGGAAMSPAFEPTVTPMATPRAMTHEGPLPYGGDEDLEKAIQQAQREKDTKAWKVLIQARTVRNNVAKALVVVGEELKPVLQKLGWTENEIKRAQHRADGDLTEGIKLLLKDESSARDAGDEGDASLSRGAAEDGEDEDMNQQLGGDNEDEAGDLGPKITSDVLRRLSIDSTWHLLQSTDKNDGDQSLRKKAWKENCLLLVQVSSLQRQGRLSLLVKKKMKTAVANGLGEEVRRLLKVINQTRHRDSVDREDSLFASYKCPLTDDLLHEPVTLSCGHTFSKRPLEGVLLSGNKKCPICRCPMSGAVEDLKVNILLRDTITRLFADRVLQMVKRDIAALKPENMELAAEELFLTFERYKANEDIIDLAVQTLLSWPKDRKQLGVLSRRGVTKELVGLLKGASFSSTKFIRRTLVATLQCLRALGEGAFHAGKVLSEAHIWEPLFPLLAHPKLKGPPQGIAAVEAFEVMGIAIRANQEAAVVRMDHVASLRQVLAILAEHGEEEEVVAASLKLAGTLLNLALVKGTAAEVLTPSDAITVVRLWDPYSSSLSVLKAILSVLSTGLFQKGPCIEALSSTLVSAGLVDRVQHVLASFEEDKDLLSQGVPLLLRLGYHDGEDPHVINDEVVTQLKNGGFVRHVCAYVESLGDGDDATEIEDPVVFEKTSNTRLEIQSEGTQVVVRGKGWVIGNAIPAGVVELAYEIKQEDKDDECSCLGISLVPDPPSTAEYRSTGTPFITLRCFSGEIYREGQVVHVSDQFKAHPGDTVHVLIDSDAGTINFQVNEVAPVTVVSDLHGKSVYPVGFFYLGEAQASERWPIIELRVTVSRVGKAMAYASAVDAPLDFTLLHPSPPSSSLPPLPLIEQDGQVLKRLQTLSSSRSGGRSTSYAYAIGPPETSGVHTYRFKNISGLPTCCGVLSADALEGLTLSPPSSSNSSSLSGGASASSPSPSPAPSPSSSSSLLPSSGLPPPTHRLTDGPPEALRCALAVAAWASGRVVAGTQPSGLRPLSATETDVARPTAEVLTLRLKLIPGGEGKLELYRGTKLMYDLPNVLRYLPANTPLCPFVALLSPGDAVTVDHQIIVRKELQGLDRKKWASRILEGLQVVDRVHRSSSLDAPPSLTLPSLLSYLQESSLSTSSAYRVVDLLSELRARLPSCCPSPSSSSSSPLALSPEADEVTASVATTLVSTARKHVGDPQVRKQVLSLLLSACFRPHAARLVESGLTPLLLLPPPPTSPTPPRSDDGLTLLLQLLTALPCPFRAYVHSLGVWPRLASSWPSAPSPLLHLHIARLLLVQSGHDVPQESLHELASSGHLSSITTLLSLPPQPGESPTDVSLRFTGLSSLLTGGGQMAPTPPSAIHSSSRQRPCQAFPYLYMPDSVSASEPSTAPTASTLIDPNYRRKMAEMLEVWRGHVPRGGHGSGGQCDASSKSWLQAAFWALKDGDAALLKSLLLVPHFHAMVAERPAFSHSHNGPWTELLGHVAHALPATLLKAHDELVKLGHGAAELRPILVWHAREFRKAKKDMDSRRPSEPGKRWFRYPKIDGTIGTFAVDAKATAPFGFQHDDLVFASGVPQWGYGRVIGVEEGRLWLHFQTDDGASATEEGHWDFADLHLVRSCRDPGTGHSEVFRLPLDRGTRVVRGPDWEWSTQDGFPGNIGTVLGNGGGDGWFRVQWDNHGSNSYQYTPDHQDIVRYNDPLENPIVSLFPQVNGAAYMEVRDEATFALSLGLPLRQLNKKADPRLPSTHEAFTCALDSATRLLSHASLFAPAPKDALLTALVSLCLGHASRLQRVLSDKLLGPALLPPSSLLLLPTHLMLLSSLARDGDAPFLDAFLSSRPDLLPSTLALVLSDNTPLEHTTACLTFLERSSARSPVACATLTALLTSPSSPSPPIAQLGQCLSTRLLDPSANPFVDAHVSALRLLKTLIQACPPLGESLFRTPLGQHLVPLILSYAAYADSGVVIDEVTELASGWTSSLHPEAYVRTVLTAATIGGDYGKINARLKAGGPSVVRQAVGIIRQHVMAQASGTDRERVVGQIWQAGTLEVILRGLDKWWAGREDVQSLAALCNGLLEGSNMNEAVVDAIVSPHLVAALWPALAHEHTCKDRASVEAVLSVLAARDMPNLKERSRKRPLLWPTVAPLQGRSMGTVLAQLYAYWAVEDPEVGRFCLELLASVVTEVGELEREGMDTLLSAVGRVMPPQMEDARAALRILGASTLTEEEDMVGRLPPLVAWVVRNVEDKATVETAIDLLLRLVDESETMVPEEIHLSSGSLNVRKLFVMPKSRPPARKLRPSLSSPPPMLPSPPAPPRPPLPPGTGSSPPPPSSSSSSSPRHLTLPRSVVSLSSAYADNPPLPPSPIPSGAAAVPSISGWARAMGDALLGGEAQGQTQTQTQGEEEQRDEAGNTGTGTGSESEGEEENGMSNSDDDEEDEEEGDGEEDEEEGEEEEEEEESGSQRGVVPQTAGWEPTRTRLPHSAQLYIPGSGGGGEAEWTVVELEQKDYGDSTPKTLEVSAGTMRGKALPLPTADLRKVRTITLSNRRETSWLPLVRASELKDGEDVIQVSILGNFTSEEASKVSRFRVRHRARIAVERIVPVIEGAGLLPLFVCSGVVHKEDIKFLRHVLAFLKAFFPEAVDDLKEQVGAVITDADFDQARGRAAGITFSEDGKRATFPFGPKLLVSTMDTSTGNLRWIFKSSGNSSWAVGAIPRSKIDRHDVMMAEQSIAVATTSLTGGRVSTRKPIQNRVLEVVLSGDPGLLTVTLSEDREHPIRVPFPAELEPMHLAIMGYSGTVITFSLDF